MEKLQMTNIPITSVNLIDSQIEKKKFDLVFIGGGPSTIAFISYLFQKRLAEKIFSSINILIIEKDENFGSGCLGKYGINTNTSGEGFPRLICYSDTGVKDKNGKFALSPSKYSMKSSKNYNLNQKSEKDKKVEKVLEIENNGENKLIFKKIPLFQELYESTSVQTLLAIGNRPAPLSLVGYFLDCLGNFLINHIDKAYGKNIFLNKCEVKSIKLYNNEEYGIVVKRDSPNSTNFIIKTKCLVLSTGGKQSNDNPYYKSIVNIKGQERVFQSDWVLQEQGYKNLTNLLKLSPGKKTVVIIGGSHSGFSSAWILLNTPANYGILHIGRQYNKLSCNKCINIKDCICYGKVIDRYWNLSADDLESNLLDDLEILILYRDHIRVYYPSEEEAHQDNYTCYDPKEALNKHGKVYPFIGIRGDAKELYNKVIKNEETRIKLIRTQTNAEQLEYIKSADAVIWACGYTTKTIPIYDARNYLIELLTDEVGTIEVDKQLQLINKNKTGLSIKNLFGIGQGYSTKTPEIINGKKARADSIHIYNTHIANKLYRSLEPFFNKIMVENLKTNNFNLKRKGDLTNEVNTKLSKRRTAEGTRPVLNLILNNKTIGKQKEKENINNEKELEEKMMKEFNSNGNIEILNDIILPNINSNKIRVIHTINGKNSPKNLLFNTYSNKEIKNKKTVSTQFKQERVNQENNIKKNNLSRPSIKK